MTAIEFNHVSKQYRFGQLAYRTVRFEQETLDAPNYQGNPAWNRSIR